MIVASLDPGTTSGLVVWEGEFKQHMGGEVAAGLRGMYEIHGPEKSWSEWLSSCHKIVEILMKLNNGDGPDVLLIEDFILEGGKGHSSEREGLDPVRITCGVLMLLEVDQWSGQVVYFQPSIASVFHDVRMKKWGLWLQGRNAVYVLADPMYAHADMFVDHGDQIHIKEWTCAKFEGHATSAARGLVWWLREKI